MACTRDRFVGVFFVGRAWAGCTCGVFCDTCVVGMPVVRSVVVAVSVVVVVVVAAVVMVTIVVGSACWSHGEPLSKHRAM